MFREKRADTLVSTVERTYGVNLNVRADALLGNLLDDRGFDSLSQLLAAYRGKAMRHARARRLFLSFHAEDRNQVNGFRLMMRNQALDFEVHDESVRSAINSEASAYIKRVIAERLGRASVLVCLVGNGTAWREWVDWEIRKAVDLGKGICAVRLKESRGRAPPVLDELGVRVVKWGDPGAVVAAIEQAAARRSSRNLLR